MNGGLDIGSVLKYLELYIPNDSDRRFYLNELINVSYKYKELNDKKETNSNGSEGKEFDAKNAKK